MATTLLRHERLVAFVLAVRLSALLVFNLLVLYNSPETKED